MTYFHLFSRVRKKDFFFVYYGIPALFIHYDDCDWNCVVNDWYKKKLVLWLWLLQLNWIHLQKKKKDWEVKNSDQIIMYIIFTFVVAVVAIWVVYDKFFDMDFAFVVVVIWNFCHISIVIIHSPTWYCDDDDDLVSESSLGFFLAFHMYCIRRRWLEYWYESFVYGKHGYIELDTYFYGHSLVV